MAFFTKKKDRDDEEKTLFQKLTEGVDRGKKTPLKEYFLPTSTPVKNIMRGAMKFPDTSIKYDPIPAEKVGKIGEGKGKLMEEFFKQEEQKTKFGGKALEFLTSIPGEMVREFGRRGQFVTEPKEAVKRAKADPLESAIDIATIPFDIPTFGGASLFMGGVKPLLKKGGREVVEKVGREAVEKVGKEIVGEGVEKVGKELFEEGTEKVVKKGVKKTVRESSEKLFKEGTGEIVEGVEKSPVVRKVIDALSEAKPIRQAQEAIYSQERKRRFSAVEAIGKKTTGEAGFFKELSALKGELPKVEFQSVRKAFGQSEIDSVFDMVKYSDQISIGEKIRGRSGLLKLFGQAGGQVPQESELKILNKVFGSEFVEAVLSKRSVMQKMGSYFTEAVNLPKSLMSSFDLSAPLRQGVVFITRPKQFFPAFKDMFKYFGSDKAYRALGEDLAGRPTREVMEDAGLAITDIGKILTSREEAYLSTWAEKIPIAGKVVKASERAYTGFLNKLRADVFDDLYAKGLKQGKKKGGKWVNDLASFINNATGRGGLGKLESSAKALNTAFFSPRLIASRVNLMNPVTYVKQDPFVRKEALKSMFGFVAAGTSVLGLASLAGAEVGTDPRSANFGKIKIGDTRLDIWGGFQQYIRMFAQMITGQYISSTTGVEYTLGEGYKPLTRLDILERTAESKASPFASFLISALRGTDFLGEELTPAGEIEKRFVPLIIQDIIDLAKDKEFAAMGLYIPAFFGVGTQTYGIEAKDAVTAANSVREHAKELFEQGKVKESQDLMRSNADLFQQAAPVEPFKDMLRKLNNAKEKIQNDRTLTPEQKKEFLKRLESDIERVEKERDETFDLTKR